MESDLTALDSLAWEAIKRSLNQRVVVVSAKLAPSRRNRVWLVETDVRPVVVKRFFSGRCAEEFEALVRARSSGLNVPMPLHQDQDYLVLEYISGEPCDFMINHLFSMDTAEKLGEWLAAFHTRFPTLDDPMIMADAVLQNFVLQGESVYGFDLEDCRPGNPLADLGQLCTSILSSEPMFTPIKFDLCKRMLASYGKATHRDVEEAVRPHIAHALRASAKSRPLFRRIFFGAASSLEAGWPELR